MFTLVRTLLLGGLAGKVLGVLRELLGAWCFGTGIVASAFRLSQAAFLIPLQGFVTEALNAGFAPLFGLMRVQDPARAASLFSAMHAVLVSVALVTTGALFAFAHKWVAILAPGLDAETQTLAVLMLQVLSIALPPYVASALYAAADLANGGGELMAARASVQSLGLIAGTLIAWQTEQPLVIAIGFVAAHFVLLVWGIAVVRRMGMPLLPDKGQLKALRSTLLQVWLRIRLLLLIPVLMQVHFIIERRVASAVHPGAIAALDYARFVSETAVVLLAVPFGLAGLGTMSAMPETEFHRSAARSLKFLAYVGIPLSALLTVHAHLVVDFLFVRGAFGAESAGVTTAILTGLGAGIWCQLLGYAGSKFLSARGDNRAVLVSMSVGIALTISANVAFAAKLGPMVLGLAGALGSLVFCGIVVRRLALLRTLLLDLSTLLAAAAAYLAMWLILPESFRHDSVSVGGIGIAFWAIAMLATPNHRAALCELSQFLRHK